MALSNMITEDEFSESLIWSRWVNKQTGELIKTYSMVTTEAIGIMAEIHNHKKRMPVILTKENESDWLNGREIDDFKKCDVELKGTCLTPNINPTLF